MCQSKADGGQRCFAGATARFDRATAAYEQAAQRATGTPSAKTGRALVTAEARLDEAAAELASTNEGAAQIRDLAAQAQAAGDPAQAGRWDAALRAGAALRERNAAVHAAALQRRTAQRAAELEAIRTAPLATVRSTRANLTAIRRELDAQGLPKDNPLRGVLSGLHGNHVILARNTQGQIVGGIDALITGRGDRTEVFITNVRVLTKREGHGHRLIAESARQTGARGELSVGGAIETAKPFYAKTGAVFSNPFSNMGRWTPEAVAAMKVGQTPLPGEVVDMDEYRRRERQQLREQYPESYRERYGDAEP